MQHSEEEYRWTIARLAGDYMEVTGDGVEHVFLCTQDGDGWNEPFSDDYECGCGEWSVSWVQHDPACTGRPDLVEVALEWNAHVDAEVNKDIEKFEEELRKFNGDISQD